VTELLPVDMQIERNECTDVTGGKWAGADNYDNTQPQSGLDGQPTLPSTSSANPTTNTVPAIKSCVTSALVAYRGVYSAIVLKHNIPTLCTSSLNYPVLCR
jgi:hypothetical protein